jgi:uncharacterized protein YndB with AHSA1/START domain
MQANFTTPDLDAVVSEIEIAAPRERVFQALADATQLKRWFSDPSCPVRLGEIDARPGGGYRYLTEKGTVVLNNMSAFECQGEILELDPPHILPLHVDCELARRRDLAHGSTLELTPKLGGTQVKVTHSAPQEPAQRAQGLFRRVARRSEDAKGIRRAVNSRQTRLPLPLILFFRLSR